MNSNFAILMCGSKGYKNYRHIADLFTWKHLLLSRGYKEENIITLAYNDLNTPIYHECGGENIKTSIDYENIEATKNNFLNIISYPEYDNITRSFWLFKHKEHINNFKSDFNSEHKKHLNFTGLQKENINVVIIYINHGSVNMLSVPNKFDEEIYVDELQNAINMLSKHVNNILLFIEACYSGSFITNIKNNNWNNNILVFTAASGFESSYSFGYCEDIETFTTDEFTYNVINFIDNDKGTNKINDLINYVSKYTTHSHIMITPNKLLNKYLHVFFSKSNYTIFEGIERNNNNKGTNNELKIINPLYSKLLHKLNKYSVEGRKHDSKIYDCYKTVTKIVKRLCFHDINETLIKTYNKIGKLCKYYTMIDIINELNNIC